MSRTVKGRRQCRPTHPGEMLREDFLPDYQLTASGLARAIGVSRQSVNELLRGAQRAIDLWDAERELKDDIAGIKTLNVA